MLQYLRLARELIGYGEVVFPHCSCDSRKEGHVIASVGAASFKLQACREDGSLEVCMNPKITQTQNTSTNKNINKCSDAGRL